MIIEERNSKKEQEDKRLKLKEMWETILHDDYEMDWEVYPVVIKRKGTWKGYSAANVTLKNINEDIINIVFENGCEEDLETLRGYFGESKNKFMIEVDGFYY